MRSAQHPLNAATAVASRAARTPKQSALSRRLRRPLVLFSALLVSAAAFSFPFVWQGWVDAQYGKLVYSAADVPSERVALVLGARVYANGRLSGMLRDRVETAVALYKAGKVQKLLMSGDNSSLEYNEPDAMVAHAVAMGVPPEDEPKVLEFTNAVFGTDDPAFAPTLEVANRNYLNIFDYGRWLFEQRRREPKEDVVTLLVNARINGEPLDETDLLSYFSNMISAGNETTRSSLSGAIWALDLYRDARESLLADPSRLAAAVDEILRWFTPVYHMARTARRDVEVGAHSPPLRLHDIDVVGGARRRGKG